MKYLKKSWTILETSFPQDDVPLVQIFVMFIIIPECDISWKAMQIWKHIA